MNQYSTNQICLKPHLFAEIHTFSAKEKDTETGYSVTSLRSVSSSSLSQAQTSLSWHSLIRRFGSRYYSSELSIWLSVDPQAHKYTSTHRCWKNLDARKVFYDFYNYVRYE